MSAFVGRIPLPPTANAAMVWDGTEFRPTSSVSINPVFGAISASALALAIATGISDPNRIGFLPDTSILGSESLTTYVGGNAGPKLTARSGVVDLTLPDGGNAILGIVTGSQIGTSAAQKLSFFGATPIVQPTGTTDLRTALINLGLYATGGASPLNLNGGAFTAASITNSSLTSGRVTFATTAGLMTDSAALLYGSSALTVGDGTTATTAKFVVNRPAASIGALDFQTGGVNRWRWGASTAAESGSNAGSAMVVQAFDDAGASIDIPISITRAAGGAITFTRPLQPGSGTVGAPSIAFSTDTTTGLFRPASGNIGFTSSGVEKFRFGTQFIYSTNATVLLGTAPINAFTTLTLHGPDATTAYVGVAGYGNRVGVFGRRANGTASALTASAANDVIFEVITAGYEGTTPAFTGAVQAWRIFSAEAYTSAAQGTYQDWFTVATGATAVSQRMRLFASGTLGIGTTTDGLTANGSLAIAQDFAHRGTKYGVFNTAPIAQKTGYGTPTGNAYQASFAAGSITLPNLAAAVAQLILDLKAYGQIGT